MHRLHRLSNFYLLVGFRIINVSGCWILVLVAFGYWILFTVAGYRTTSAVLGYRIVHSAKYMILLIAGYSLIVFVGYRLMLVAGYRILLADGYSITLVV